MVLVLLDRGHTYTPLPPPPFKQRGEEKRGVSRQVGNDSNNYDRKKYDKKNDNM
jgi:hypothetical protein